MTTVLSTSGKAVKISTDATGEVRAMYVQDFNTLNEFLLQAKTFKTTKNAINWAYKILNISK
jgi:phage-related protein